MIILPAFIIFLHLVLNGFENKGLALAVIFALATGFAWSFTRVWKITSRRRRVLRDLLLAGSVLILTLGAALYFGVRYEQAKWQAYWQVQGECHDAQEKVDSTILQSGLPDRFQAALKIAAQHPSCQGEIEYTALRRLSNYPNEEFSSADLDAAAQVVEKRRPGADTCDVESDALIAIHIRRRGIASMDEALDHWAAKGGTCWGFQHYLSLFSDRCKGVWRGQCESLPRERLLAIEPQHSPIGSRAKDLIQEVWEPCADKACVKPKENR